MPRTETTQQFGSGMTKLLNEYATKLEKRLADIRAARDLSRNLGEAWNKSRDWEVADRLMERLLPALHSVTREASQLAEQGAVDDITRVELRIRLAEVEGLLDAIDIALHRLK